ncbi:helix-turn-helix transcriptional regulator [Agromyces aerolatus]|uniref:helix-turn-helix transcriptional regulator n=1 Tax=Agromyces sp. LY-1074 TaxID=3074080 RepID=UPI002855DF71|nr:MULTISPECIES: helix-turn-helix transcriptional regulator [unclassified Agromyces]MDR5699007.1 helix-turn-helix transcriptional regulator [Agromyces sp. LY-1074]MDR5705215.1 helix-turn-helix transcriptional regulator [Agromyces sp. LY-1358]
MPPFRPQVALVRARLFGPLDGPARVAAVVGAHGAGVTTVLQQWRETRPEAVELAPARVGDPAEPPTHDPVLVIDDAERLTPEGWQWLRERLDEDPGVRIRLGLRSLRSVPPELDVEVVDGLAFTPEELDDYLTQNRSRVDSGALYLTTGGHARSVRAIVTSGVTRRDRFPGVLVAAAGGVGLSADDPRLAVPAALTPATVAALGGGEDFIERAERAGLGSWTFGGGQPAFALTPLVRAVTAARVQIPATERRAIRQLAAVRLLEDGAWLPAIVEGTESGRLDVVDLALKRGGMPLLWDEGRAIVRVVRGIPLTQLRRRPVIAMAQALVLNARRQHAVRAAELMGVALLGIQTGPRNSPDRALLRVIESVARRLTGFGDGGVKAARSAARMLDEMAPADLDDLSGLVGDLRVHAGISLLYAGHLDEAQALFERAAATPSRVGVELMALGGVAMVAALQGDIHAARHWTGLAEDRSWPPDLLDEYPGSMLRIAQAIVALEGGRLDETEQLIDRIWPIIDTIEHWPILGHVRALLDVRRGTPEHGLEAIRMLRRRRGSRLGAGTAAARMLDLAESTLALAAGDLATARRLEAAASDDPWIWLGAARVAVFEGDDDRAFRLLGESRAQTPADRLGRLSLEAVLLSRLGREDEAAGVARRADALARSAGVVTPLALVPASERDLFATELPDAPAGLDEMAVAPRLTEREAILLHHLFTATRLQDIAAQLHVSLNTLKTQRRSLYRKLRAGSREEALASAIAHGLIDDVDVSTRAMNGTEHSTRTDARPNSRG